MPYSIMDEFEDLFESTENTDSYSIMDEFEDLFESTENTDSADIDSDSDDFSFKVSFDPSEELLNEEL